MSLDRAPQPRAESELPEDRENRENICIWPCENMFGVLLASWTKPIMWGAETENNKKKHLQEVLEEFSHRYTEGKDPA